MKYRFVPALALGLAAATWGQQSATPAAADSGQSLGATMHSIQEQLSKQGQVSWTETVSNQPGMTIRETANLGDVMADPEACTLYATQTVDYSIDLPSGRALKPGVTADDLHSHVVETDTLSFKQVGNVTVEKMQDVSNQTYMDAGHKEISVTVTPPVFYVKVRASSAVFASHTSTTKGKQAAVEMDATGKTNGLTIRDEETANRVAKAMIHAVELCGGGAKKDSP
jgi:hypothetical protein